MSRRPFWLALAAAVTAAACSRDARPAAAAAGTTALDSSLHGGFLQPPRPKPDITLTATDGTPYALRRETDGYVTLLFFGYTHCPDICPVHMANLGAVLKTLPPTVSERVKVVFVTIDPERDTPEALRAWLDKFDRRFVGLTGTPAEIDAAVAATRLPAAIREAPAAGSADSAGYTMGHTAFLIAYTRDGMGRLLYPFGVRQGDWALDLPKLVAFEGEGT